MDTTPRLPMSAVIITKNEGNQIEACIKALQAVTDEIVVVDAFSDDDTPEICKRLGVRFIQKNWEGYSINKNFGNAHCKNDWIISIDADEVLSSELIQSIQNLSLQSNHVYLLDRLTNFCGKWVHHSGWYPDWKPRIFHRNEVSWKGNFVHEQLSFPSQFTTKKVRGKLLHYSYHSLEAFHSRQEKYAQLAAKELFAKQKRASRLKEKTSAGFRFFRSYILKLGFLDGKAGWQIAKSGAFFVRRKYQILRDLYAQG